MLPGEPGDAGGGGVRPCEVSRNEVMIAASAEERDLWYEGWPDEVAAVTDEGPLADRSRVA